MKHRPWIGNDYRTSRLLIVGESAYPWRKNGRLNHPGKDHASTSVRWIVSRKGWTGDKTGARFLFQITRALAYTCDPNQAQRRRAWASCAFVNYVQSTGGEGAGTRPTTDLFRDAQRPFLELLEELRPHRVIVLGKTMWSKMPECQVYRHKDLQAYMLADRSLVWVKAMVHPRGGLSWQPYAKAFDQFKKLPLPEAKAA